MDLFLVWKLNFPDKKYQIIYADPAWEYNDEMMHGGAPDHYDIMNNEELKKLPIQKIADENCILFLWVTLPKLNEVFDLISAWGFTYKTVAFTWIKTNKNSNSYFIGMGRWTRSNPELCLLCTKGKPKKITNKVRQLVVSPVGEHSKKPNEVRNRIIQLVGDLPRIELFARTKVHGWDVWGNDEKLQSQPLEVFS